MEVSIADLQGGWNEIEIVTRRRTGVEEALVARIFLGEDAFQRTCEVTEVGGPDPASLEYELACTFEDGFHGELAGEPMIDGKARIAAADVPLDPDPAQAGVLRPLVVAELPLDVVNRADGRWPRPVRVVVPLPLVQLSVQGWQSPWYETAMPVRLRAEAGSTITVDGVSVRPTRDGGSFVHEVPVERGDNTVRIEAHREGRVPAIVDLAVVGRHLNTPLNIDEPVEDEYVTSDQQILIRGSTVKAAKVYLGGRPVDVNRRGRFEVVVPLDEGDNEIDLIAVVDADTGVRARPPSKRSFKIHSTPDPDLERTRFLAGTDEEEMTAVMADLGDDPWRYVNERVQFPMVLSDLSMSLSGDGCTARVEGQACTHEVSRDIRVGFETITAWACDGDELPAVVEMDECPEFHEGQRVMIVGTVLGGLGGRVGQWTVERPRFRATSVEDAPFVRPSSGGR